MKSTVNHMMRSLQARYIKCVQCFVDAKFASVWNQADADNAGNVMLHKGYVIAFAGCPVLW